MFWVDTSESPLIYWSVIHSTLHWGAMTGNSLPWFFICLWFHFWQPACFYLKSVFTGVVLVTERVMWPTENFQCPQFEKWLNNAGLSNAWSLSTAFLRLFFSEGLYQMPAAYFAKRVKLICEEQYLLVFSMSLSSVSEPYFHVWKYTGRHTPTLTSDKRINSKMHVIWNVKVPVPHGESHCLPTSWDYWKWHCWVLANTWEAAHCETMLWHEFCFLQNLTLTHQWLEHYTIFWSVA